MEILAVPNGRPFAAAVLVAAATFAASCGTFVPPVEYRAADPSSGDSDATPEGLVIAPVEGRPGGLVLSLETSFRPEEGGRLRIRRRLESSPPKLLRTIELGGRRAARFADEGIRFVDRGVRPGRLQYRVEYVPAGADDESRSDIRRSAPLELRWRSPPPRPDRVRAEAPTPHAVELRWKPTGPPVLVFRRNVLDPDAKSHRLASRPAGGRGILLDRDVQPGGVYAYRVALAVDRGAFKQYGPPSESLYVSVPEN